ncbi:alcohol dehydrogenase, partial [Globisporangium splendens]
MPSYRTVQVHQPSTDFRTATKIIEVPELPVATPGNVVVQNNYVGINAADINITNGVYSDGKLPFGCGLEGVGVVVTVGEGVENFKVGDAIAFQKVGAFAEYVEVAAATAIKVPTPDPSVLPLVCCGISASVALEEVGQMKSGETVLVTSAAGGTGLFVVQLAKLKGNHVIGTCSSDEKAEALKALGVDRVINYSKEDIREVLKKEYPKGVDLVFESVGGDAFKAAVENIAVHGRVIVFGSIASYKDGQKDFEPFLVSQLNPTLLTKSASVRGFLLSNHAPVIPTHFARLFELIKEGKLKPGVDPTEFKGFEGIPVAIDYMYARKNIGKLVVKLVCVLHERDASIKHQIDHCYGAVVTDTSRTITLISRFKATHHPSLYADGGASDRLLFPQVGPTLLMKSASVRGFISNNHLDHYVEHLNKLMELIQENKLRPGLDPKIFRGLEEVPLAIDYLCERKNKGKIAINLVEVVTPDNLASIPFNTRGLVTYTV